LLGDKILSTGILLEFPPGIYIDEGFVEDKSMEGGKYQQEIPALLSGLIRFLLYRAADKGISPAGGGMANKIRS
jgi:hypothetical protein